MDEDINLHDPSIRPRVSAAEWAMRVDLAACYRLVKKFGFTDLIHNHATARVPDGSDHLLINGYGFDYAEISASNLYKIDLDGNIILKPDAPYDISRAGYVIHSAIHAARKDVVCCIHTHTRAGMAVSAMECGLLPITQQALRFHGRVAYHDYEGPAVDTAERQRLVKNLGELDVMILRNHGLLVCGRSVAETFNTLYWLESACQAQVDAMSGGTKLVVPPPEVIERTVHLYKPGVRRVFGEIEWGAMRRTLDRDDPTYRS